MHLKISGMFPFNTHLTILQKLSLEVYTESSDNNLKSKTKVAVTNYIS